MDDQIISWSARRAVAGRLARHFHQTLDEREPNTKPCGVVPGVDLSADKRLEGAEVLGERGIPVMKNRLLHES